MLSQLGEWRPVLWLVFAYSATLLLLIILFADETWYPRGLIQLNRPTGVYGRFLNLTGVTAFRERQYKAKVSHSCMRLLEVFFRPVILISFFVYMLSRSSFLISCRCFRADWSFNFRFHVGCRH